MEVDASSLFLLFIIPYFIGQDQTNRKYTYMITKVVTNEMINAQKGKEERDMKHVQEKKLFDVENVNCRKRRSEIVVKNQMVEQSNIVVNCREILL